jgi:hypothetical protein
MSELVTTERVVIVLMRLQSGETPTTKEVSHLTGMTTEGARRLLNRLCLVIPLTCVKGRWQLIDRSN